MALAVCVAMLVGISGIVSAALNENAVGVDLSCNDTQKSIPPGGTTKYMITVKNTGNMPDTINLTVQPWLIPPCGWSYGLNKDNVTLLPDDSTEVILYVSDVLFHSPGDSWAVTVTGTSQGDPTKSDSVTTTTTIEQLPPSVSISTDKFKYWPDDTMMITIDISNPTDSPATFNWYLGVPQFEYWTRYYKGTVPAGFEDTIEVPLPVGNWGSTPFAIVWYVDLQVPETGEILDADETLCLYWPYWAQISETVAMPAVSMPTQLPVDIAKEIGEEIEGIA